MKQGIIILTKPSNCIECCGHHQHELVNNRRKEPCCPDSWIDGDYLYEYPHKCSKRYMLYREYTQHQVTVHIPSDATFVEMITIFHEQIEKLEAKLGTKVFFQYGYLWSEWNQAPKELPKLDRKKIRTFLFGLSEKMFPSESKYYERIKQLVPPDVLPFYVAREIHASRGVSY